MDYSYERIGVYAFGNDGFGALTTEGARFIVKRLEFSVRAAHNNPFGAGYEGVCLCEEDPSGNFVAGTRWLQMTYYYEAAAPGRDTSQVFDFGDEGLMLPSHTPFNEYRRFGFGGGIPATFGGFGIPIGELRFNFAYAYEMTGGQVNYLS